MVPVIVGDEVRAKRCICLEKVLARRFLKNDEIFFAPLIKSELYQPGEDPDGNETGDRTEEDLFLKGSWSLVCSHLRWCLLLKRKNYPEFTFKLVDDQRLIDVYVGNEAFKNKSESARESYETNNSLSDLVRDPSLLLVRLGILRTANKAAASAVLSALTIRAAAGMPVWIIEGDRPFGDGHRAYNHELGDYIDDRYEIVDLRVDKSQALFKPAIQEVESIAMGVEDSPPQAREFDEPPPSTERFNKPSKKPTWKKKGRTSLPDMGL
jgi:hypothetical protein